MGPEEVIIPIVLFISLTVVLLVFRKFTNDERLALIEKGGDANIFSKKSNSYPALRYGLLLIGAGIGILIGNLLAETNIMDQEAAVMSCILIFGGTGLFASFFMEKKAAKKENS